MYKIKQKPEDFIVNEITNINLKDKGAYSVFLLKKTNYTTERAIFCIAQRLKIDRKFIGYAGNKDKLAITTQYISIKNSQIKELKLKDIELEFKGYLNKPICLGDLAENEFEIKVISDKIPKKIDKIVNYFGEQRFSINNKAVGKAIVKKEFKKSIKLILENKGENEEKLKKHLKDKPNDYIGALRVIPRKILTLYVNSYQSYLFNKVAESKKNNSKNEKIPIIGFGTELTKETDKILKKEGINQRDFIIRQIPELTSEGTHRDLFTDIIDLEINKIDKGYLFKFRLNKGCYATEVIKQMF